jgi:hypothetical protein
LFRIRVAFCPVLLQRHWASSNMGAQPLRNLGKTRCSAARIVEVGRTRIDPAIGWGLLLFFGLPILAVLALVTLVGIPLGLGLLAALALIYALGYGATAWIVGRRILREPTAWILAFLVGWGILRVLALVPILGGTVWFAAVTFGLGVLAVANWRARFTTRTAVASSTDVVAVHLGHRNPPTPELARELGPLGARVARPASAPIGPAARRTGRRSRRWSWHHSCARRLDRSSSTA